MAKYPDDVLAEIKSRIRLSELVGKKVQLKKAGAHSFKGKSPFSNEKTPSFYVHDDRQFFKCFSTQKGGDCFTWLQEAEGHTFPEAVQMLAEMAGVPLRDLTPEERGASQRRERLFKLLEVAQVFFQEALGAPAAASAREYLAGRGFGVSDCARFGIGFAPAGHAVLEAARLSGFERQDCVDAGIARRHDDGGIVALFRRRITFPVLDQRGRVVTFGARAMGDAQPKYLNGPATALFDKSATLYGLHESRALVAKGRALHVVEGYFDVLALLRTGEGAAAPMGTAITEGQLEQLWRVAEAPVACFDGDRAGAAAAARMAKLALPLVRAGRGLKFVRLPPEHDVADLHEGGGRAAVLAAIEDQGARRTHFAQVWADLTAGADLSDPTDRANLKTEASALLRSMTDEAMAREWRTAFTLRFTNSNPALAKPEPERRTREKTATPALREGLTRGLKDVELEAAALLAPLWGHPERCERHSDELAELPAGRFEDLRAYLFAVGVGDGDAIGALAARAAELGPAAVGASPQSVGYNPVGWDRAFRHAIAMFGNAPG